MYIVLGFKPGEQEPARLEYGTLDEAMQKLRDLVEADEIDDDGPMFCEYGIVIDPLPRAAWDTDEEEDEQSRIAEDDSLAPFRLIPREED